MIIIGLTGPAGSGKDTVAGWLEAAHDYTLISLADPIRRGLAAMFGLSPKAFMPGIKEQPIGWVGKSPRELMQTLGTEWGRHHVAHDIWLRFAEDRIRCSGNIHIVITDIRFEDEAAWVRDLGGSVWFVRRNDVQPVREHVSESGIAFAPGDNIIDNNGTIEDLFAEVDDALNGIPPF